MQGENIRQKVTAAIYRKTSKLCSFLSVEFWMKNVLLENRVIGTHNYVYICVIV